MQPDDLVCRVAIFPKFAHGEVFDDEQFLNFQSDKTKTTYATSVVSDYLMRTENSIHEYGEAVASMGNQRLEARFEGAIPKEKENIYLGYYKLRYRKVVAIEMSYYWVQIKWRPENNCDAHFQIEMWPNSNEGNKGQRRRDRTHAVNQMANSLMGPTIAKIDAGTNGSEFLTLLPKKLEQSEKIVQGHIT